jgi:hypothetical protein
MTSENRQYVGKSYAGNIDASPTTPVFNLPTVNVLRSGTVGVSGISAVNIIGGFKVVIDAATLVNGQVLLMLASGGVAATVSLSNGGGTIAGVTGGYLLKPGNFLTVQFDGMNLA